MTKIISFIWRTISTIRTAILNLLFIALIIALFSALSSSPTQDVTKDAPLFINLSGKLVEQTGVSQAPIDLLLDDSSQPQEVSLSTLIQTIRAGAKDDDVSGLIIKFNGLKGANQNKLDEIAQAIATFKASDKPVIAVGQNLSQQEFYLAAAADEIYLHPMGAIYISGYGVYRNYMKTAIAKLKVKLHVFKAGDFKDATENFTRDSMSEASRKHTKEWVSSLWQRYESTVTNHRSLNSSAITDYINAVINNNDKTISPAELAKQFNLIDLIADNPSVKQRLIERFGKDKDNNVKHTHWQTYASHIAKTEFSDQPQIGIIYGQGNIVSGHGPNTSIAAESMLELLNQANNNKQLKTLVLRLDTGGGDAFASELIREAVLKIKAKGIPVYASMSSVTASGGYWIASAADEIWASPATLTGSIGVWGLFPNLADAFNHLGIYSDGVGTTPLSDAFAIDRPMQPQTQKIIQQNIDHIYYRFVSLVSESRNKSYDETHQIAQGRIWTGEKAQEIGLVDQLGGLYDLTQHIRTTHELEDAFMHEIKRELSPKEAFLYALANESSALVPASLQQALQNFVRALNTIESIVPNPTQNMGVQALCLDCNQ